MTNTPLKNVSLLVLLAAFSLAGCQSHKAPQTMYQWGSYENQIYAMYDDPGKVPIEDQLQSLEQDFERIRASNALPPPGLQAHMGYLYFQAGKAEQALRSFEAEKKAFPESAVYMDQLIARLKIKG